MKSAIKLLKLSRAPGRGCSLSLRVAMCITRAQQRVKAAPIKSFRYNPHPAEGDVCSWSSAEAVDGLWLV